MRALSLLAGITGTAAATLLWWRLSAVIQVPADGPATAARLGLALAYLLPTGLLLWAMLLVQMGARFIRGAFIPSPGTDGPFLLVNQRVISNSVEHLAVFAPTLLALAAGVGSQHMPWVLALAVVFACARAAFWAGYLIAPLGRSLGMAATLAATTAALAGAISVWTGLLPA